MAELFGRGPLDSKLWVVGESPEGRVGELAFSDRTVSGKYLIEKFILCGLDPVMIRLENLTEIRPIGNKDVFWNEEENKRALEASTLELYERIKEGSPYIIVCMGKLPLNYLMKMYGSLDKYRGHIFWSDEFNIKMMVTYHPVSIMKQRHLAKKFHPGQYEALFQADLMKAKKEAKTRGLVFFNYEKVIEPTFNEAKRELIRFRDEAKIISYDIETLGHCLMDCIGFAERDDSGICIPFYIPQHDRTTRKYWNTDREMNDILNLVSEVLHSPIPKVAQNSQFDMAFLKYYYDIDVLNMVWDTMIVAHELYCSLPKSLDALISFYTNLPYHKHLIKEGTSKARWEYNVGDVIANLHVMKGEMDEIVDLDKNFGTDILGHYHNIGNAFLPCLVDMHTTGVNVDNNLREPASKQEELTVLAIQAGMNYLFGRDKFNPNSHKQKINLFYHTFHCKRRFQMGQLTTNKAAMEKLVDHPKEIVSLLAQLCLISRASQTMHGKLETPLINGRIHTKYDITGTITGRLNSKGSDFGGGTNLQNLSKGIQRKMVIPG